MDNSVGSRFKFIADKFKKNIAVISVSGQKYITYEELDNETNIISNSLLQNGIRSGDRVGVIFKDKYNWVISILALLKIGATYVPLDEIDPVEYVEKIIQDIKIKLVLTDNVEKYSFINCKDISNLKGGVDCCNDNKTKESNKLAYIMFTSGTTGKPKGVGVTHENILNLTVDSNYIKLNQNTKMLQTGSQTFDASTFDVWGTLLNGGTLILIDKNRVTDITYIESIIIKYNITTMWLTAPLFNIVAESKADIFRNVEELIIGGDVVKPEYVNKVFDKCKDITIFNGYGPTECTTFSTVYKMGEKRNGKAIPIGKPIKNVFTFVLDEKLNLVNKGEEGELFIGGKGVSVGYINNIDLNRKKFIDNPFGYGKLYKTGDIVKEDVDGNLYFLGRKDRQVKIRGYRIELDAVEKLLKEIKEVKSAIAVTMTNKQGEKEICSCVSLKENKNISSGFIRKKFSEIAPAYITISQLRIIDKIPINKNGKIDYKLINELFLNKGEKRVDNNYGNFINQTQSDIASIISKITGNNLENKDISFFEIGVDSLTAVYIAKQLKEKFNIQLSAIDVLSNATINDLSNYISKISNKVLEEDLVYIDDKLPILNQQKSIFIDYNKNPYSTKYNIPLLFKLPVNINLERLINVLENLIDRHKALKVKFYMEETNIYQKIQNVCDYNITKIKGEPILDELIRPFDLISECPYRFSIIKEDNRNKWLFMDFHHIIMDGVSLRLVLQEINDLYKGKSLKEINTDYMAVVKNAIYNYENSKSKCIHFYEKYFEFYKGMNELPIDQKNDHKILHKNDCYKFEINSTKTDNLREWCRYNKITIFEGLMLIYSGFLHVVTYSDDIIFATPSRSFEDDNAKKTVSMLTDTLWIYSSVKDKDSINNYIIDFVNNLRNVQKNKNIPVEFIYQLKRKDKLKENKFIDTLIAYHSYENITVEFLDINTKAKPISPDEGMFLLNMQIFENKTYLEVEWEYMIDAFERDTIKSLTEVFLKVLDWLISEDLNNHMSLNELILYSN